MSGIVDTITSVLGTILYPLFSVIFLFIDGIQHVFYAFAGIGNDRLLFFGDSHAELFSFFIALDSCPSVSEHCFFISPL